MYETLERIALTEYSDIVTGTLLIMRRSNVPLKLRLLIRDGTFIDVWLNPTATRYSYHWEQRAVRGCLQRHDNAPDHPNISTHPKHFHNGSETDVKESHIPDSPPDALRYVLDFARRELMALGL